VILALALFWLLVTLESSIGDMMFFFWVLLERSLNVTTTAARLPKGRFHQAILL
jgi:hypothetical protein